MNRAMGAVLAAVGAAWGGVMPSSAIGRTVAGASYPAGPGKKRTGVAAARRAAAKRRRVAR